MSLLGWHASCARSGTIPTRYVAAIERITRETKVPMAYVVGGGAVFFAGRDIHFGSATPAQQAR